jgi:hypothetical protein
VQNTAPDQSKLYHADVEDVQKESEALQNAQAAQVNAIRIKQLGGGLATGAGGEARMQIANYFKTFLSPDDAKSLTNLASLGRPLDAAEAQEMNKLITLGTGAAEKEFNGSRGGLGIYNVFKGGMQSMDTQPDAVQRIGNMQLVTQQAKIDYIRGEQDWVNQHGSAWINRTANYQPLTQFDQQ